MAAPSQQLLSRLCVDFADDPTRRHLASPRRARCAMHSDEWRRHQATQRKRRQRGQPSRSFVPSPLPWTGVLLDGATSVHLDRLLAAMARLGTRIALVARGTEAWFDDDPKLRENAERNFLGQPKDGEIAAMREVLELLHASLPIHELALRVREGLPPVP